MKNKRILGERGITLIALVVTIVVLLILAGVTINAVFSDSGIIKKAQEAQNKANESAQKDMEQINALENWMNSYTEDHTENGDKFMVKFCDYDGTLLQTVYVAKGGTAEYTKNKPTRPTGGMLDAYKFNRWVTSKEGKTTADLTNISSNLEVYASYVKIVGGTTTDVTHLKKYGVIAIDGTQLDEQWCDIVEDTEEVKLILEELKSTNKTFKEYFNSESDINSLNICEFINLTTIAREVNDDEQFFAEIVFTTKFSPGSNFHMFLGYQNKAGTTEWEELECEVTDKRRFKHYFVGRKFS